MNQMSDTEKFAKVVEVLQPWLPAVVIAGGWAHRLHRLHALAEAPAYLPLMTRDVDVALGPPRSLDEADIRERLLASGFTEEMSGEDQPPVTQYQIGNEEQPFYVEFLTPLVGSENRRDGTPDVTERIRGISAQKLRHLDVLLLDPWLVKIGPENGFPLEQPVTLRVANPAAYIAQKLLILGRRKREDRPRDLLYVHDTLQTFAGHLGDVRDAWLTKVAPNVHPRHANRLKACVRDQFSEVTDTIRGAAEVAESVGRPTSPEAVLEACQLGLKRIFL